MIEEAVILTNSQETASLTAIQVAPMMKTRTSRRFLLCAF